MKLVRATLWMVLLPMIVGGCNSSSPPRSSAATGDPVVADVHGKPHHPLDLSGKKAAVLFFLIHDCPISNAYSPEIARIVKEHESRGVAAYVVQTDRSADTAKLAQHAADFGYPCPVLMDREHALVKRIGATVAPEAAVIGADGQVRYIGRIDDRYVDFGKQRAAPTTRDLRDALEAVLTGKPVPVERTKAIGCFIGG